MQYIFILYLYIYARWYNILIFMKVGISCSDFLPRSVFQDAEFHKMVSLFCTSFVSASFQLFYSQSIHIFSFSSKVSLLLFSIFMKRYILMIFVE